MLVTSRRILFTALAVFGTQAADARPETPTAFERRCQALLPSADKRPDAVRFKALVEIYWDYLMTTFPEWGTYVGRAGGNDRWTDLSRAAIDTREREVRCPFKVAESIKRARLSAAEQLTYDLFLRDARLAVEGQRFKGELLQVSQLGAVHQDLPQTLRAMPQRSRKDYENILARLEKAPTLIEQVVALLREGLAAGVTPPRQTLRALPAQVDNVVPKDPDASPLLEPFKNMPPEISDEDRENLKATARKIVVERLYPALQAYQAFLANEYVPRARESISWTALPDGAAWYAYKVRDTTTTDMTPDQIHELGLSEVKRIRGEMEKVVQEVKFRGSMPDFFQFLRTDKRFFHSSTEDLLREYRDIAKRADPELTKLFGKLPRLTYGVTPIPSYAEKSAPTAYYEGGSYEAGRPANFLANTYDLKSRPRWEMEALTLHEAVPGHHLQIALMQELENVPEFRKHQGNTAYVEGWALYAEQLGYRMGFYKDPYSRFGQLTYEMWRACRLVVDTGMHHKGWSRDQAIQFMKDNMPKPEHDIIVEVDRYIVWAGQALAYKIGQLQISALRDEAQKQLGAGFDIRKFHDQILKDGALPMEILQKRVREWIMVEAKAAAKAGGKTAEKTKSKE